MRNTQKQLVRSRKTAAICSGTILYTPKKYLSSTSKCFYLSTLQHWHYDDFTEEGGSVYQATLQEWTTVVECMMSLSTVLTH